MTDLSVADNPADTGPDVDAEPVELGGKDLLDAVAGEMGWKPKDKFGGDPEKWRDSVEFLKATPGVLKSQREQIERSNRVAAQQIEKAQRAAMADAERRIAEAADAGDREAVAEATRDLKEAAKAPSKQLADFAARNTWYMTNTKATRLAIEAAEEVMQSGGSEAEQMAAGEAEVRKRFPELFDDELPEVKPSKGAPVVSGGQRAASPAPRKRGWPDIPSAAREAADKYFIRKGMMTKEEYAEQYFVENP